MTTKSKIGRTDVWTRWYKNIKDQKGIGGKIVAKVFGDNAKEAEENAANIVIGFNCIEENKELKEQMDELRNQLEFVSKLVLDPQYDYSEKLYRLCDYLKIDLTNKQMP